jgi:hypothetical protein
VKHRMGTDEVHVYVDDEGRLCAAYFADGANIETHEINERLVMLAVGDQRFVVRKVGEVPE